MAQPQRFSRAARRSRRGTPGARQQFLLAADSARVQKRAGSPAWLGLCWRSPGYHGWRAKVRLGPGGSASCFATVEPTPTAHWNAVWPAAKW